MSFSKQRSAVDGKYPFETVASFSCNLGYYLSGTKEATCESSGKWNKDYPECKSGKEIVLYFDSFTQPLPMNFMYCL